MKRLFTISLVLLVSTAACAQQPADDGSKTVATFGDEQITEAELTEIVKPKLVALRQQEYDIKRQNLEQAIFDRLVEQAAAAEGISSAEYIKKYVTDRAGEPSEDQIAQVLNQYRSRLNPDEEKARQQVVAFLKQQESAQLNKTLRARLFNEAKVRILLEPVRFEAVVTDVHPSRGGGADAPIVLIEYTDFQCPYCSRVQPTINAILERYGDNVQHVFKQLPLPMHPQAKLGGEASLCAADQGKFWEMHDWLFANKNSINREALAGHAGELGMDVDVFNGCLDEQKYSAQVDEDMKEAQGFGITGTPGFLINGRALRGAVPLDQFIQIIDEELIMAGIEVPEPEAAEQAADAR
jgi:protein-disulfide isomerase